MNKEELTKYSRCKRGGRGMKVGGGGIWMTKWKGGSFFFRFWKVWESGSGRREKIPI